jgi:hypothetical protein
MNRVWLFELDDVVYVRGVRGPYKIVRLRPEINSVIIEREDAMRECIHVDNLTPSTWK